ncbi:hypothetical protein [Salinicoccus roseus]|uniref:hypothetical protein n=1 Tax=Salinicoccus roseus TaxID=45670 RepID=UPI000F4F1145|nr:hypothetical protein [Salinicoccus roseus]RPE52899.1 hypothetical protein EDC33_1676 [Salinicoccus roseus]GGA72482.1 hypothetical protein GCM10007176_15790 [Salinicoccus roseus]
MGIRIGDFLSKNHKFSESRILKAMKLAGMLEETQEYSIPKKPVYNISFSMKAEYKYINPKVRDHEKERTIKAA